jgi:hypothetical protein
MIRRKQEMSKQPIRTDDHERSESRTSGFMRIETLPYIRFPLTALSLQKETSDSERLDFRCVQHRYQQIHIGTLKLIYIYTMNTCTFRPIVRLSSGT